MSDKISRSELKYVLTDAQLAQAENALRRLMRVDRHAGEQRRYTVRSLYFDDAENTSFYENENGNDPREKFRIRVYNGDISHIQLELKQKQREKTYKHTCRITESQCRDLMAGRPLPVDSAWPPVLQKLLLGMRTRLLRPVVIVQYERYPFELPNSDVRVTLDRHLTSSSCVSAFLENSFPVRPVMPLGHQLMEVKFDHFLPGDVYSGLSAGHLRRTAFSKYYLCRKYSLWGLLG